MTAHITGEVTKSFKARSTILHILEHRGYNISPYTGFSISEVHTMFQNEQLDMLINSNDNTKKVYVKFHLKKNLRQNNLYDYVDELFIGEVLNNADDLIIISPDNPNDTVIKTIREIWSKQQFYITALNILNLQFNILHHNMVPKHKALDDNHKAEIMKKYNVVDDSKFADISRFDPVAIVLGLRPGQLCEITRPSRTAINTTFYRICSA
jgi:DNA-directed RNA polymerase subunit H (RpoH/RPB5)